MENLAVLSRTIKEILPNQPNSHPLAHKKVNALTLVSAKFLGEKLFCLTHIRSPSQMGQDDVFVLQLG